MRLLKNYYSIELNTLKYTKRDDMLQKRNLKCTILNIGYVILCKPAQIYYDRTEFKWSTLC